jgi:hypothetical protein
MRSHPELSHSLRILANAVVLLGVLLGFDSVEALDLIIEDISIVTPERAQPLKGQHLRIRDQRIVEISPGR